MQARSCRGGLFSWSSSCTAALFLIAVGRHAVFPTETDRTCGPGFRAPCTPSISTQRAAGAPLTAQRTANARDEEDDLQRPHFAITPKILSQNHAHCASPAAAASTYLVSLPSRAGSRYSQVSCCSCRADPSRAAGSVPASNKAGAMNSPHQPASAYRQAAATSCVRTGVSRKPAPQPAAVLSGAHGAARMQECNNACLPHERSPLGLESGRAGMLILPGVAGAGSYSTPCGCPIRSQGSAPYRACRSLWGLG